MKEFDRRERIGSELQRVLAQVLHDEVRDPRLANITLHEVRVVKDLSHAKVYFTCFQSVDTQNQPADEVTSEQVRLLNGRLAGFLRHALAQRVRLRTMPQLHFVHDESIRTGERLSALIDGALEGATDEVAASNPDETGV